MAESMEQLLTAELREAFDEFDKVKPLLLVANINSGKFFSSSVVMILIEF